MALQNSCNSTEASNETNAVLRNGGHHFSTVVGKFTSKLVAQNQRTKHDGQGKESEMKTTKAFSKISDATDFIFSELKSDLRLATPLGLGKPNLLLNSITEKALQNPTSKLKIYTALSLGAPQPKEKIAQLFLKPFAKRQWGEDYPQLKYYELALKEKLPPHIQVHEFYFQAGSAGSSKHLQRHYQSVNYTHVAENILKSGVNVLVQMIAKKDGRYSLSCNPDLTLDVAEIYKQAGQNLLMVAVIHPDLPFLGGEAEIGEDFFDVVVESSEVTHELFALPRQPISPEDHLIGFYASQFVRDGGTIQIGIGSLSDAIVSSLRIRQSQNQSYQSIQKKLQSVPDSQCQVFEKGLYGLTEMLTDGFMHLRQAGILHRTITDEISKKQTFLHGSFILGSKPFYEWLRNLSIEEAQGLRMTRVSKVNDLYDPQESLLRQQRIHPRFFNTTMQISLLGEAMSETLPNGLVVSGVGGQYNFVAMSQELKDSRSVLMFRSWRRDKKGKRVSNVVWNPGHVTVPRHLRDIAVTEYGVADLKGKSDEECIRAMLNITDSEFQPALLKEAITNGKLHADYVIPEKYRNNSPGMIKNLTKQKEFQKAFVPFPFGSDFTQEEENLALALSLLQEDQKESKFKVLKNALLHSGDVQKYHNELKRMKLDHARTLLERLHRKIISAYLHLSQLERPVPNP